LTSRTTTAGGDEVAGAVCGPVIGCLSSPSLRA
jgi:hypothetical protein